MVPVSGVERISDVGAWAVLSLFGDIDVHVVARVREAVDELVCDGRVHLVWDLEGVSFMDSAGLGVLVYTMRSVEAREGSVRLAGPDQQVRRLLELTGLDAVVECHPDVASAAGRTAR
ncbi:STAS domain-containing protein [Streptomyces sp. NPDC058576]|uniref:STAS domain-containing protein n=1 Tax=Streptomyces sp. NPDC058576 TaxID=3346547 RepID=UPI0036618B11